VLYQVPSQSYYVYGNVMLSSRRASQISGTLLAGLEKSTFLRYSLLFKLWVCNQLLLAFIITSYSLLNHFYRESYCKSVEYVLCRLLFRLYFLLSLSSDWLVSKYVCQRRFFLIPQFCTLQTEVKTFFRLFHISCWCS